MSSDTEEGYVHRPGDGSDAADGPGAGDGSREARSTDAGGSVSAHGAVHDAAGGADAVDPEEGFGRRGWLLVGAVVFATLVAPGIIYLRPATPADAGLPFLAAMLVLPLVPAVLLGLVAVWSMSSSARSGDR